jgi:pyruvate kinase
MATKRKAPRRTVKAKAAKTNPNVILDLQLKDLNVSVEDRKKWYDQITQAKAKAKKQGRKVRIIPTAKGLKMEMKKKRKPSAWILFVGKHGSIDAAVAHKSEFEAFKKAHAKKK